MMNLSRGQSNQKIDNGERGAFCGMTNVFDHWKPNIRIAVTLLYVLTKTDWQQMTSVKTTKSCHLVCINLGMVGTEVRHKGELPGVRVLDTRLGSVESSEGSLRVPINVEGMFISLIVGVRVGLRDLSRDNQMNKMCSPYWWTPWSPGRRRGNKGTKERGA